MRDDSIFVCAMVQSIWQNQSLAPPIEANRDSRCTSGTIAELCDTVKQFCCHSLGPAVNGRHAAAVQRISHDKYPWVACVHA